MTRKGLIRRKTKQNKHSLHTYIHTYINASTYTETRTCIILPKCICQPTPSYTHTYTNIHMNTHMYTHSYICCILTLDRAVNQRCICVSKRKKKRKQVGVMKEYREALAAVELVGDRKARLRASLQTEDCGPQRTLVEQPQPRCGRSAAMVKRRSWVNIAVCPCLHSSFTYHRNIENKV